MMFGTWGNYIKDDLTLLVPKGTKNYLSRYTLKAFSRNHYFGYNYYDKTVESVQLFALYYLRIHLNILNLISFTH